jgi:hypothetical protein
MLDMLDWRAGRVRHVSRRGKDMGVGSMNQDERVSTPKERIEGYYSEEVKARRIMKTESQITKENRND